MHRAVEKAMRMPLIAALSLVAGTTLLAGGAAAQYYPPPPYGGGYYRPPPPPYYGGDYYGRPYGRPAQLGQSCVTSRGTCYAYPSPVGSPCRCFIPGFGKKRGAVY
jgi:hypothetical protein